MVFGMRTWVPWCVCVDNTQVHAQLHHSGRYRCGKECDQNALLLKHVRGGGARKVTRAVEIQKYSRMLCAGLPGGSAHVASGPILTPPS